MNHPVAVGTEKGEVRQARQIAWLEHVNRPGVVAFDEALAALAVAGREVEAAPPYLRTGPGCSPCSGAIAT